MNKDVPTKSLEQFRAFLCRVARGLFPDSLRSKLDASDIVQQTLLEAHAKRAHFRGSTDGERAAWLRLMLLHNLADAQRTFRRDRRDLARERPLAAAGGSDSTGPGQEPASDQSSPSQQAERAELAVWLAEALADLPEGQRQAVVLYYWQGASLADIARELGRSPAAAAGLLKRGLKQLRAVLQPQT
jgi:RNA polymerase sigma-70 factor (ECF subfamily)